MFVKKRKTEVRKKFVSCKDYLHSTYRDKQRKRERGMERQTDRTKQRLLKFYFSLQRQRESEKVCA